MLVAHNVDICMRVDPNGTEPIQDMYTSSYL